MMSSRRLMHWAASNWFALLAPLLAVASLLIARSVTWQVEGATLEAAFIFDACVTLPLLYALCYGRSKPLGQVALRMLAIGCLGIYLLTWIVPPDAQSLLPRLSWVRTAGLAVLIAIELRIVVSALRLVFRAGATAEQLSAQTGAPPLIARLMLLEARMWKGLWRFLRRD